MTKYLVLNALETYQNRKDATTKLSGFRIKSFLGSDIDKVFLQFEVEDLNMKKKSTQFSLSRRIVFTYISFLFFIAQIFILFGVSNESSFFISFIFTVPLIGLYWPFTMIITEARVMLVRKDGTVDIAGSKITAWLDGLFGAGGLLSAFQFYSGQVEDDTTTNIFVFIFLMIFALIGTFPLLFPALYVYYRGHAKLVNDFRDKMRDCGIKPARTTTQALTGEEIQLLTLGEVRSAPEITPDTVLGKATQFITRKKKVGKHEYSAEEEAEFIRMGGWMCDKCGFANGSKEVPNCEKCGKEQPSSK